jgi:hypothetical protein
MRTARSSVGLGQLLAALALLGTADACFAADAAALGAAPTAETYQQPLEHQQPRRVGAAGRGASHRALIAALVPDHLGLTASEQPTLYWVLPAPVAARIEIVLNEPEREAPLLELSVAGDRSGMHAIDLREHAVRLRPGVQYEWSVAIVLDTARRARDVVSGGAIMRIAEPAAPTLAERWYDILSAYAERAVHAQSDPQSRLRLAALLEQVGLGSAAIAEESR